MNNCTRERCGITAAFAVDAVVAAFYLFLRAKTPRLAAGMSAARNK